MIGGRKLIAKNGSIINYINGNDNRVTINNGLDVNSAKSIFNSMLLDSFPYLRGMAKDVFHEAIDGFVESLIHDLSHCCVGTEALMHKLSSPDVQNAIYVTARSYALSPKKQDMNSLINLVTQKIVSPDDDLENDLLIDIAIETASKLKFNQIMFLALIFYISRQDVILGLCEYSGNFDDPSKKIKLDNSLSDECIEHYKRYYGSYMDALFPIGNVNSTPPIGILKHLRCIYEDVDFLGRDKFEAIYFNVLCRLNIDLKSHKEKVGCFTSIVSAFGGVDKLSGLILTPVGSKIATAYITSRFNAIKKPTMNVD